MFIKIRIFREKFRFSYSNCKIGTNPNYSKWSAAMRMHARDRSLSAARIRKLGLGDPFWMWISSPI